MWDMKLKATKKTGQIKTQKHRKRYGGHQRRGWEVVKKWSKSSNMMMEGYLTLSGEYTRRYTDDTLHNCMLELYIILLTNDTPINLIKFKNKQIKSISKCQAFQWKKEIPALRS